MNERWDLYPERLSRLQRMFWSVFYLFAGGGSYFFIYHLLLPSRDASTPPAWGRAAKESFAAARIDQSERNLPGPLKPWSGNIGAPD